MDSNEERKSLGSRNKSKGNVGERYYRNQFIQIGYNKCVTSRLGSKLHDNAGLDLVFLPYNVQIKVGLQKGLKPRKELIKMATMMEKYFPEDSLEFTYPKLVVHRMYAEGSRRTEFDEIVTMTFKDFKSMAETIFNLQSELKELKSLNTKK